MNHNLDGYDLYTQQTKSSAGGAALYVSNLLNYSEVCLSLLCDGFENIWIEIKRIQKLKISYVLVYIGIPPPIQKKLREYLESIFQKISNENKSIS